MEQIEARQDDVLARLDELNERAEKLLKECLADHSAEQDSSAD
jgi:hypothetical protein